MCRRGNIAYRDKHRVIIGSGYTGWNFKGEQSGGHLDYFFYGSIVDKNGYLIPQLGRDAVVESNIEIRAVGLLTYPTDLYRLAF